MKTYKNDDTEYWHNEKGHLHRLDGPAVIYKDGDESWYKNGKRHRLDGPAMIRQTGIGYNAWFINGKEIKPIPNIICYLRKKINEKSKN